MVSHALHFVSPSASRNGWWGTSGSAAFMDHDQIRLLLKRECCRFMLLDRSEIIAHYYGP